MSATIETIKQLRQETGAGVMECRKALEESDHNYAAALAALREKAAAKAEKQAGREALQGKIELYSHNDGRIGVMVEINTETEFAANAEVFRRFTREIALQITAAAPRYICDADIPAQILDEQAQAASTLARSAGKPEHIVERIVAGVLEKYKNQHVLLRQVYIRDESLTVAQLLSQAIAHIGENIVIRRFVRWEMQPDTEPAPNEVNAPAAA